MNILVVGLKNNIQLKRLQEEGKKKGHTVDGCYAAELIIKADEDGFIPSLRGYVLSNYDLIYLMVSKRRWEWYTAALYLENTHKAISGNYNFFLTPAIDYLKMVDNSLPLPRSAIFYDNKSVASAVEGFDFPLILKTSAGRQGRGVFKVESLDEVERIVKDNEKSSDFFVLREYIPNNGDIRVFTVGYKVIGAMKRTPKEGDFRSNISQGGSGEEYDIYKYPELIEIAERMSEVTQTEIAGVDIIINKETGKPYILEINPGPQFEGLEKYTDVNAAEKIIAYFESKVQN